MWTWLNESPVGSMVFSWIKVFIAVVLTMFLADGADIFAVSVDDIRLFIAAAFTATIPMIVNYINPRDSRYGKGS